MINRPTSLEIYFQLFNIPAIIYYCSNVRSWLVRILFKLYLHIKFNIHLS